MYLEAIQRLSMYIVRKQKYDQIPNADNSGILNTSVMDQETINNIKSLMDEHVFELLDKTEVKVMSLQKDNIELLEELTDLYQKQATTHDQIQIIFDIMFQFEKVFEDLDLSPQRQSSGLSNASSHLNRKKFGQDIPDALFNLLNKVYSRRFDFEK